MTNYFISKENSPDRDSFAETDFFGGAVTLYLPHFKDIFPQMFPYGSLKDDITWAVMKAVLVHEDLHLYIGECVDTTGGGDHESVYMWIEEWLNSEDSVDSSRVLN
jgi:hypothetical protein